MIYGPEAAAKPVENGASYARATLPPLPASQQPGAMSSELPNGGLHPGVRPEVYDLEASEEIMWRWRASRDMREMELQLRASQMENERLREELQMSKSGHEARFHTPDEERKTQNAEAPGWWQSEKESKTAGVGKGVGGSAKPKGDAGQTSGCESSTPSDKTMEFMMVMLQSMQEIQRRVLETKGDSREVLNGVELVRNGVGELPPLGEWDATEGPLRMGDWLCMLEPLISDFTETSEEWWRLMMQEVMAWYRQHMALSPLDRVSHSYDPPASVSLKKWQRLERRVAGMLLKAIPESQKADLIAAKKLGVFAILTALQVAYQPGGQGEKCNLLKSLEEPPEATSAQDAVNILRRWIRWRQRALDIHATEPDPTVLVRGLSRIVVKILDANPELSFRISLARSSLLIDSAPDRVTVGKFVTHLLAEVEQVAYSERKNPKGPVKELKTEPKVKQVREDGYAQKTEGYKTKTPENASLGGGGDGGNEKPRCRFFNTDAGCRKGKSCGFAHVRDGQKRCFACGSTKHFADSCPISPTAPTTAGATKVKAASSDGNAGASKFENPVEGSKGSDDGEKMNALLEEANKMLAVFNQKKKSDDAEAKINLLQEQLNRFRKSSLKTLRVTKLKSLSLGKSALLDSGATNPLRSIRDDENLSCLDRVWVSLADGHQVPMLVTKGGITVSTDTSVEPIVPLGWLDRIGCEISWKNGAMRVRHPERGLLPVEVVAGCPQVPKDLGLELIQELEGSEIRLRALHEVLSGVEPYGEEREWMQKIVSMHPVLSALPDHVRDALVISPGELKDLPANRHQRKRLGGKYMLHLYAGEKDGFPLQKAFGELGMGSRILEVDIKRGQEHQMLGNSKAYAAIRRSVLNGEVLGVCGGPNCRTRSVLRHYYRPGAPRPVRAWEDGQEWGRHDLSLEEREMVHQDDILMWRMLFIYVLADLVQQVSHGRKAHLLVEQPAIPHLRECVTFWKTEEWIRFRTFHKLEQQTFNQGDFMPGHAVAVKPTTIGATFLIQPPKDVNHQAVPRGQGDDVESSSLARWNPGMMRELARSMVKEVFEVERKVKAMSWQDHVAAGHVPFRRDCRVCQEASAKARPHRSVVHPLAGILSLDTCGPLKKGYEGRHPRKFILVGTFTWVRPKSLRPPDDGYKEKEEADAEQVELEDPESVLPEEEGLVEGDDVEVDPNQSEHSAHREVEPERHEHSAHDEPNAEEQVLEVAEERLEEPEIEVHRMAIPLANKFKAEILGGVSRMYLQLRTLGYQVRRIHTDKGGEFLSSAFKQWCVARDIKHTTTSGADSESNG